MDFANISYWIQHVLGYGMVAMVALAALGLIVVSVPTLMHRTLQPKTA